MLTTRLRRFLIGRWVPACETIPQGYGIAWRLYDQDAAIAFPLPLNWIAFALHSTYLALTVPKPLQDDVWREGEHAAAFLRGVQAGRALERPKARWDYP